MVKIRCAVCVMFVGSFLLSLASGIPCVEARQYRPVVLVSDSITNQSTDMARLEKVKTMLTNRGISVTINGIGPGETYRMLKGAPDGALCCYIAYCCAGTMRDFSTAYYKKLRGNRMILFINWSDKTDLYSCGFLPRAHDDNFSPASFKGIERPLEYLKQQNIEVIQTRDLSKIADKIAELAGKI